MAATAAKPNGTKSSTCALPKTIIGGLGSNEPHELCGAECGDVGTRIISIMADPLYRIPEENTNARKFIGLLRHGAVDWNPSRHDRLIYPAHAQHRG